MTTPSAPTLFERLGGRDKLRILLRNFYGTVRADPVLGPIFEQHVHNWTAHIENIANFWSTQTGGPALYRGGMGKHFSLGIQPAHFELWLRHWENSCRHHLPDSEAMELVAIARGFASRMTETMKSPRGFRLIP
jgi:hemoglobin